MKSYNDLLHQYKEEFIASDIPVATIKAFLFELCNDADIDLYTNLDFEADPTIAERFHQGIKEILEGRPMNYVLGYCWFYGYRLKVNNDVLIPRYETEELVLRLLQLIDEHQEAKSLVDIGTGSGAIAISLKKECEKLKVYATDISVLALKVAESNAQELGADITFMDGDMLQPLIERNIKVDILVSNPPYIPEDEVMEHSVVDFEPHVALFGGADAVSYTHLTLPTIRLV